MLFPKEWVAGAPFQLSPNANLIVYIIWWAICILGLFFIWQRGRALGFSRWTTQDILVLAIMGVLLEVYDNLIGDQFITPIINLIPFGHALALNDLPYMFLLMTGIVKPAYRESPNIDVNLSKCYTGCRRENSSFGNNGRKIEG